MNVAEERGLRMERFAVVKKQPNRTQHMISMQNWVENLVCGTQAEQKIVGNRKDNLNIPVSQLMFENKNRWAHVCPYVRDALDYDHCWIEELDLDGQNPAEIDRLLRMRLEDFKSTHPAYDPALEHRPAPLPVLWKTFIMFLPKIPRQHHSGPFPLIDDIYAGLLPTFIREGLMFGEFYPGCPTNGIYNDRWSKAFVCPFPAFVIRYMAQHDHLFIGRDSPNWAAYNSYFPQA